jgi:virulence factor Mce-like protein
VRRLAGIALLLAAGAVGLIALGAGGTSGGYRVDALFDNADYLIAGQDVKIAGARVGSIEKVKLTPDHKARVVMRIDPGFAPFRANADCQIRPQSLIGEKFVECDPGTAAKGPLSRHGGEAPTVPVAQTHSPVDLDLVFTALKLPLRERLSIVVNELGTGLAGRPRELNAAIRRANPALQQANRTLAILDSERHTLARLIDGSDRVIAELAAKRRQVSDFIDRADAVTRTAAGRRGDLDLAVQRLPALLAELEPAARDLTGFATDARPVVRSLAAAAPQVRALLGDFDPLADAARPTLKKLAALSATGRRAVRASMPVADLLDPVARRLPPAIRIAGPLVASLRDKHAIEEIGPFLYNGGVASSRFDRISHILPSYQISGQCQQFAETPTPGCDAHYGAFPSSAAAAAKRSRSRGKRAARPGGAGAGSGSGSPSAPGGDARGGRGVRTADLAQQAADAVAGRPDPGQPAGLPEQILDWLLQP